VKYVCFLILETTSSATTQKRQRYAEEEKTLSPCDEEAEPKKARSRLFEEVFFEKNCKKQKINKKFFVNNISGIEIPINVLQLLNKGVNFNILMRSNVCNVSKEWSKIVNTLLSFCQNRQQQKVMSSCINIMNHHLRGMTLKHYVPRKYKSHFYYQSSIKECIKFIKNNKLIIKPADKNLGLTIMNLEWYENQVMKHLNSDAYIREIPDLRKIKGNLYDIKEKVFKKFTSSKELYLSWTDKSKMWKTPEFYVIPKLHKNPVSSRPIVPSHTWITTEASKWLDAFFKNIVSKFEWCIPNSQSVILKLESLRFDSKPLLVAMDIESMYTNIKIDECLRKIKIMLLKHANRPTGEIEFALRLLEWVMNNNYFKYKDTHYKQVKGFAMGTPCAPNGANLFLIYNEILMMKKQKFPQYYFRYLDDIFIVWLDSKNELQELINTFNRLSDSIHLTYKYGHEATFMDLKINYVNENTKYKLKLSTFSKPENRFIYTDPDSYYPKNYKYNWIQGEHIRHIRNNSTYDDYTQCIKDFVEHLLCRKYDRAIIKDQLTKNNYSQRLTLLVKKTNSQILENKRKVFVKNISGRNHLVSTAKRILKLYNTCNPQLPLDVQWIIMRDRNLQQITELQNKKLLEEI